MTVAEIDRSHISRACVGGNCVQHDQWMACAVVPRRQTPRKLRP